MAVNLRGNAVVPASDPATTPPVGSVWVETTGRTGSPGAAMGPMGLTYAAPVIDTVVLRYRPLTDKTVQVGLV